MTWNVRIGINPISWMNDDLPSLGGDTLLETALAEGREIGYEGFELGNKFPKDGPGLKAKLGAFGLADPAAWGASMAGTETAKATWMPKSRAKPWPGGEYLFSFLAVGMFVLWWIGVLHFPGLLSIELRGEDAGVSGAPIWSILFGPILLYAFALIIRDPEVILRVGISLCCGKAIPLQCFCVILLYAFAPSVHDREVVLRYRVPSRGHSCEGSQIFSIICSVSIIALCRRKG